MIRILRRQPGLGLCFLLAWITFPVFGSGADTPADTDNQLFDPSLFEGLDWRMIGPHRGGRVTAVAGVNQDKQTFYMGASGGGVWKTTDLGMSWKNLTDHVFATGSIGAIDVADSDPNVIFVGTGSACIRSNVITGRGVYRSTDAGESWAFVGLPESGAIGDVVISPRDPDTVFVAALGHPFGPNPERGVYRSKNGGESWEQVLFVSAQTGAVDLTIDPHNPRHLLVAMWQAERKPWTIKSGGEEGGVWRSTDGGDSWKRVERGLPSGLIGKIAVEISPADPSRVWALVEAPGDGRGLYRSEDGGASFRKINDQTSLTYRPFYYTHLTADPLDRNRIYVNNETFWLSIDGGETFERRSTPHGDNHALWIHPDDPLRMVQGNDGGANVSWDGGATWSPQWNQPTAELYQVEVDDRFPYRVYGAQQDNTTISVPSKISRRPLDPKQDWLEVSGCETGPVVVHPEKQNLVYGGCKGRHSVFDFDTGQTQEYWVYPHFNYGHDTREMPFRFQRTAPMIISRHDPDVIYHGSHVLHRSDDGGRSWKTISPDLTAFEDETQGYSGEPITRDITGEEVYSTIYAIAESPHTEGVLWVGSNDGPIHLSRDGGESWNEVTPEGLPKGGRVNRIEPSPHAPGRAYVALYRFQLDDWQPYVYRTDDWGASWQRLTTGSNGIPADTPVRVVREDPDREDLLYAGTEFGIFVSFDGGAHWQSLQLDLAITPVTDIKVHRQDLVISTMGRSFWILDDVTPLHQLSAEIAGADRYLFEPRAADRARWVGNLDRSFPGYAPEYPDTGAALHYWLAEDDEDLTLEILAPAGEVLRAFEVAAKETDGTDGTEAPQGMRGPRSRRTSATLDGSAGMHRFVWDLRIEGARSLGSDGFFGRGGPLVVPGVYRVRLSSGDWQQTHSLDLRIDPRIAEAGVTQDDLQAQYDLAAKITDDLDRLRASVLQIRDLREQLDAVTERLPEADRDSLEEKISTLAEQLTAVEELLVQREEGKVGAELEPQLEDQYTYLYGMVQGADQRPGADAYERYEDVRAELDGHLETLERLLQDRVPALDRELREQQIPYISGDDGD